MAPEIYHTECCGMPPPDIESANNLFGTNGNAGVSGVSPGPTDIVPSVPLEQILGPLKNNGGPTQTHALVAGSPAIDAGNPGGCQDNSGALLQTDQRGFPRDVDGNGDGTARCDIGAVEGVGSAATPIIDFDGDGKSGPSRLPRWRLVHPALIRWSRHGNNLGRCAAGYPAAGRL